MFKRIFYKHTPEVQAADQGAQWSSSAEFDEAWQRRIEVMAHYIEGSGPVADFGCGMMWLKPLLPPINSYIGIDCLARTSETIVLDLNRNSLDGVEADIAFLSGVLEYIEDVQGFVQKLKARGFRQIILSYCTTEKHGDMKTRRGCNWVSHESLFDLLGYFLPDFCLTNLDNVNNYNTVLVFSRRRS